MEKRTLQNRLTTKSTSQVKSKLLVLAFKLTWKSGQKEQEKLDKDEHFSSWECNTMYPKLWLWDRFVISRMFIKIIWLLWLIM